MSATPMHGRGPEELGVGIGAISTTGNESDEAPGMKLAAEMAAANAAINEVLARGEARLARKDEQIACLEALRIEQAAEIARLLAERDALVAEEAAIRAETKTLRAETAAIKTVLILRTPDAEA